MNRMRIIILSAMLLYSFTCPVFAQPPISTPSPDTSTSPATAQPEVTVQQTIKAKPSEPVQLPDADQSATEAAPEEAQEGPSVGLKIVDVLLVRPFCLIGSTASTTVYIALSPLVYLMGIGEESARVMVEAPWRFTAFRYIGEFDHYKDEKPIMGVWEF